MNSIKGESTNGNLQEALDNAIEIAKEKLKASYIDWKLETVSGTNGGFVEETKLFVVISAKPHGS